MARTFDWRNVGDHNRRCCGKRTAALLAVGLLICTCHAGGASNGVILFPSPAFKEGTSWSTVVQGRIFRGHVPDKGTRRWLAQGVHEFADAPDDNGRALSEGKR